MFGGLAKLFAALLLLPLWATAQTVLPPCPAAGSKHNCSGEITFPNGNRYIGDWQDNKPHGRGTIYGLLGASL
ncbi:MAG: hypothetical protein ACO26U_13440 [Burkholderiaceae bacterium]